MPLARISGVVGVVQHGVWLGQARGASRPAIRAAVDARPTTSAAADGRLYDEEPALHGAQSGGDTPFCTQRQRVQ